MVVVELVAWAVLGAAAGVPFGLAAGVVWAPFLRSSVVREAVTGEALGVWWADYAAGFAVLGAVHVAVVAVLAAVFGSRATLPDIVVGVPVILGLLAALLLVRAMDGVRDALRTYVVVMGGVLWYVLVTAVFTLLVVVRFLPFP